MPKTKIKELRANRLVLEDLKGNEKVRMDASCDGLVFINVIGSEQASFTITIDRDGNPKVNFCNKKGRTVLGFGISDDVGQGITISDSEGRPVCWVFVAPDGIPRIRLLKVIAPNRAKKLWSTPEPKPKKAKPLVVY